MEIKIKNMNEFTHRIATLDDIPAIEQLMMLSINQLLGPLLTKDQLEASFDSMGLDDQLIKDETYFCLLYTSPSPRDATLSRMPSSA